MTSTHIDVLLDGPGAPVPVGRAFVESRRGSTTTVFEYRADYLARSDSWSVSPDLSVVHGRATTAGLPGAFADSAPDRWGRRLIERRHRATVLGGGALPSLTEIDYLLGVSDETRQGALRFARPEERTFLAEGTEVPRLVRLPELLHAARMVDDDSEDLAAIKTLLDAGSGSLGGARPKASVSDEGRLLIAKFPHQHDDWSVIAWEMTMLDLAVEAGIVVPPHQLVRVGDDPVLLVERFDRRDRVRVPYISARTLVGVGDGAEADYVEIAEALAHQAATPAEDLRALWRRMAFSVAVNNTDDHLRNHGFLRAAGGWVLAPLFDVNPNPDPSAHRVTGIGGVTDPAAAPAALLEVAPVFDLDARRAEAVWAEVLAAVRSWPQVASHHGIPPSEQRQFDAVLSRH